MGNEGTKNTDNRWILTLKVGKNDKREGNCGTIEGIKENEMILGVISPGMAFVVMIGVVVLFVVGLIASGILNVHIEIETDEQYEERKANREMIKERRRRERSERKRKK